MGRIFVPVSVSSTHMFPSLPQIIAILLALSVHEWAHGFVAYQLGDPTAKHAGRLTLNPIAHLDFLGTLLFLTVGFGWGKPVPVNPRYFRSYRRDTALVSLAGPASNLTLAFIALLLLRFIAPGSAETLANVSPFSASGGNLLSAVLVSSVAINLGLMAFNLLPIAPLDGSKIAGAFVPLRYEDRFDELMRYGPYILLGLLLLERALNLPLLFWWIDTVATGALHILTALIP